MSDSKNQDKSVSTKVDTQDVDQKVNSALNTAQGQTIIEDTVVSKIAGLAAREVSGVYDLGGLGGRLMGSIRETVGASANIEQGISVEVGEHQAAVDISIVAEYGVAIHELAEAIRRNIIDAVESMTGLEVTEVNVTVHDVHVDMPEEDEDKKEEQPSIEKPARVQ